MTPETVHYGRVPGILAARQRALDQAFARHPERFVRNQPVPRHVPQEVWINPPQTNTDLHVTPGSTIVRPLDPHGPSNPFPYRGDPTDKESPTLHVHGQCLKVVDRLRSAKYEEVYLQAYDSVSEAQNWLERYLTLQSEKTAPAAGQHHTRCVLLQAYARTVQVSIGNQPQGYTYEDGNSVQTTEATSERGSERISRTKKTIYMASLRSAWQHTRRANSSTGERGT